MYPVTDTFLAEVRKSHQVFSYVDATGPNLEQRRITATGGSVTCDCTAQVRRYGTVNMADPTGDLEEILSQPGVTLRPYRGVKYSDGSIEVCPLGVLRASSVQLTDQVGGSRDITVEAYDLSRTVQRDKFTSPYTIPQGTNIVTAIKTILEMTFPDLQYDSISTTLTTTAPKLYDANTDPWAVVNELATSIGCDVFFDAVGRVVIAPPVDIDALPAPVFDYTEGKGCTMLKMVKKFSDEPGYNGVVLTGESVGDENPPVRSIVWDSQPDSITYHLGPYGEVPYFVQDQNVKTQSDADAAANSILKGMLGFRYQINIDATVNAALDAGDVIFVQRQRSNVSGLFALDAVKTPLRAGEIQTLTLRQKRTV